MIELSLKTCPHCLQEFWTDENTERDEWYKAMGETKEQRGKRRYYKIMTEQLRDAFFNLTTKK